MSSEMQFGDLEEPQRETRLRPDQNRHFAVVPCHDPLPDDLPIYVDLDVALEMEEHAASNTNVELGGVLLGGQYQDDEGRPFVVVTDSLRASHYEATKGSFKFTHATWEQISRERAEFPEDLQMVGWYHTHPDWGVFLSGMDLFICQNFFNRELDLALVIDPCRGDRGWFQWKDGEENPQRTGGFYLCASRFRHDELLRFAPLLQGRMPMLRETRMGQSSGLPASPTILPVAASRSPVVDLALVALVACQSILIALVAWGMLSLNRVEPTEVSEAGGEAAVSLAQGPSDVEQAQARIITELLQRDSALDQSEVEDLAQRLTRVQVERDQMAWMLGEQQLASQTRQRELELTQKSLQRAESRLAETRLLLDENRALAKELETEVKGYRKSEAERATEQRESYQWYRDWLYLVALAGVGVLCTAGGMTLATFMRRDAREGGGGVVTDDEPAIPGRIGAFEINESESEGRNDG